MSTAMPVHYIACDAHRGQFRRDGKTTYLDHVVAVVIRVKPDDFAVNVAWLHDVLEDTAETIVSLHEKGVDPKVIDQVLILTHRNSEPYRDYLERVKKSPVATKVKIADMISNLADKPTERQIIKYANGLLYLLG